MKLRPLANHTGWAFFCLGCDDVHVFLTPRWHFSGDLAKPSFQPSLKISQPELGKICHLVMTQGKIAYCDDCTHDLKGQTVEIPEWPYASGAFGGVKDK